MDKDILKTIKDCRQAIEKHRARRESKMTDVEHQEAVNAMLAELQAHGFESLQAYAAWDEAMCWQAYKEARPIMGLCDGCAGLDIPECVKKYGAEKACVNNKVGKPAAEDIYRAAFLSRKTGEKKEKGSKVLAVCPEGHGYYVNKSDMQEFALDIAWRAFA